MWLGFVEGVSHHWENKMLHLVNDGMVEMWGVEMVCLGKGQSSILDPADKIPQDENKTKSSCSDCLFLCDSCQLYWETFSMSEPWLIQFEPFTDKQYFIK